MVNQKIVAAKLAELARRGERVRVHAKSSAEELAADRDALDLVSFNLLLAVQACTDIASHVIAGAGWVPAGSLADLFAQLSEHGVISSESQVALSRAVDLRNVIAQSYAGDRRCERACGGDERAPGVGCFRSRDCGLDCGGRRLTALDAYRGRVGSASSKVLLPAANKGRFAKLGCNGRFVVPVERLECVIACLVPV